MQSCRIELDTGTRLEFWAKVIENSDQPREFQIEKDGKILWAVDCFSQHPEYYSYHHRETCEVMVSWDPRTTEFTWAYSYVPETVAETGITIWTFGEQLSRMTGFEIDAWCSSDPARPKLHFSPIRNWMNDPNGLCIIGDTWHLFYQFHPAGTDWGPMHWGHASSKDLFHWTHLPVFLHPEQNLWRLGATGGAFSGNAFFDRDGSLKLYYTERLPAYDLFEGYREVQKIAVPGRGLVKAETITEILEKRPPGVQHDFRDPKVWWDDAADAFRMVLGASIDGCPAVLLYGSPDGISWNYIGPLYHAPAHFQECGARAVECPDFFPLEGRWALVMGFVGYTEPGTGRHNLLYALVGDFENDCFRPISDQLQLLDFGSDFYAMQSFRAGERQLAMAWVFNWETRKPGNSVYSGELALPREIGLDERNRLTMLPVSEFDAAYGSTVIPGRSSGAFALSGTPFEIRINGQLEGARVKATSGGSPAFDVSVEAGILSIILPQDNGSIHYRNDIATDSNLRIIHDAGIVEVFAEDGAVCGTRRNYQNIQPDEVTVISSGVVEVYERKSG